MPMPMVVPDYADRSITNVVRAIRGEGSALADLGDAVSGASTVVLVVLDGLGDRQLVDHAAQSPTLMAARLEPITSVAPSTTAAALTSLTTGVPPGAHGIVGYRMTFGPDILQSLGWRVGKDDATLVLPPAQVQPIEPILSGVPYVGKAHFEHSGFTMAHLRGVDYRGTDSLAGVPGAVREAAASSPLVVVYYDGIDKVAHTSGLGEQYLAEVASTDAFIAKLRASLESQCALVVTSDHGQVDVGDARIELPSEVLDKVQRMTGEGRFRWLHVAGDARAVAADLAGPLADDCWVLTVDEVIDLGLLGPVAPGVLERLGDIAVIPFTDRYVRDPAEPNEHRMRSRHGSLTSEEMLVPLCVL